METVTKSELANRIADNNFVDLATATKAIRFVLDEVKAAVEAGDKVTIMGFGTFEGREKGARMARNPRTGEEIPVEAKTVPVFKAAASFKAGVAEAAAKRAAQ